MPRQKTPGPDLPPATDRRPGAWLVVVTALPMPGKANRTNAYRRAAPGPARRPYHLRGFRAEWSLRLTPGYLTAPLGDSCRKNCTLACLQPGSKETLILLEDSIVWPKTGRPLELSGRPGLFARSGFSIPVGATHIG